MARTHVLVVEDDPAIRRGVRDALEYAGYAVDEYAHGDHALTQALREPPDLVLLDVVLPGRDGFDILEELRRAQPRVPVIMLTARGTTEDRVRGLKLGADDYVVKPFDARELLARVEAVLRRSAERPTDLQELVLGDVTVDLETRRVSGRGRAQQDLSERETELLRYLAIHSGRAISRKELLQHVWGANPHGVETRTVDMHVSRLRDKIEPDPPAPRFIVTVRSKGYRLVRTGGGEK
ncbi:MAG: response regulator transcription factor [Acidobacteriota bacterium]|nr:response regulator transcription factor [Acidobacteriota bacterium]